MSAPLYLALVHHPVRDRQGEVITTAVTNLDVHDIARSCRSYDVRGYFVVTPIEAQRRLVDHVLEHWRTGAGARRVPERSVALARVRIVPALEDAVRAIAADTGRPPVRVATAAQPCEGARSVGWEAARRDLRADDAAPRLLLFGTGHGLVRETLVEAEALLPPVRAAADYNHLSVRAAVAIVLDRLIGEDVL